MIDYLKITQSVIRTDSANRVCPSSWARKPLWAHQVQFALKKKKRLWKLELHFPLPLRNRATMSCQVQAGGDFPLISTLGGTHCWHGRPSSPQKKTTWFLHGGIRAALEAEEKPHSKRKRPNMEVLIFDELFDRQTKLGQNSFYCLFTFFFLISVFDR